MPDNVRLAHLLNDLLETLREFIRRNNITSNEYRQAVNFLHRTGQIGEIPLMMDVFLETTVDEVTYGDWGGSATTIEGPYYVEGAPVLDLPYELPRREDEPGDVLFFSGTVRSNEGRPLNRALIDMWQADANGVYSNIDPTPPPYNLRGKFYTDEQGRFEVRTVVPAPYEIPTEGPTGQLLQILGKHTMRPAHIHLKISREGYQSMTTQLFFEGGEYVESDCVEAVKPELVAKLESHDDPEDYHRRGLDKPYYMLQYDFVLAPQKARAA